MKVSALEIRTGVLLVALAGFGLWFAKDLRKPTTSEQGKRVGMLFRVWRDGEVSRITIQRDLDGRREVIELVREGAAIDADWAMRSPYPGARVDTLAVLSLLNAVAGAQSERSVGVVSDVDAKAMGLATPRTTVELEGAGMHYRLALGSVATGAVTDDAGIGSTYLQVAPYADEPGGVFVVGPDFVRAIERSADAYREASLLSMYPSTHLDSIHVRGGGGGGVDVQLERAPFGTWRLANLAAGVVAVPVRADADVVNALLGTFGEVKAQPFVADSTPVDESQGGHVEAQIHDGPKLEIAFGGACPTAGSERMTVLKITAPSPVTACVPKVVTDRLLRPAIDYVDAHPFGLLFGGEAAKVSEIEALKIVRGDKTLLDAERRSDGLHLRAPSDTQADKDATDRLLGALAKLHGKVVGRWNVDADLAPFGLSNPSVVVTMRRRVDAMTAGSARFANDGGLDVWEQTIKVSDPIEIADGAAATGKRKIVRVLRVDDGAILELPIADATLLEEGAARMLRSPNLGDVIESSIVAVDAKPIATALEIEGAAPIAWRLERTAGSIAMTSPPGLGTDAEVATSIFRELGSMTCVKWVADADDGTFGFATPTATIAIHRKPIGDATTGDTITVELGAAAIEGGVYARVAGSPPVCLLADAKRDAILRFPADRSAVGFRGEIASKLVVTHGTKTRTLAFGADKIWRDVSNGESAGGAADLSGRRLADQIVALRSEGIVHLGAALPDEGFADPKRAKVVIEASLAPVVTAGSGGVAKPRRLVVGAEGKLGNKAIYYARIDGVDATYAIFRSDIESLLGNF